MKKQIKLNKITPEVRRMIHELTMTLPNVPFFIMGKTGMVPQRIAVGKRVSGQQLKEEGGKVSGGGEIDVKVAYVQRGTKTRMMNHKVTLTDQYQKKGQDGINEYVAYVKQMSVMIGEMQKGKPAGVKSAKPAGPSAPISEEEGKEIMESYAAEDALHKENEPKREDFGYQEIDAIENGVDGMKGVWSIEGGEEAYNKALAEYHESIEIK